MSSSNFNSGITLSKLNDEFVWLRTEGEYKTVERGRNSWRQTSQFNNHTCQKYIFAK